MEYISNLTEILTYFDQRERWISSALIAITVFAFVFRNFIEGLIKSLPIPTKYIHRVFIACIFVYLIFSMFVILHFYSIAQSKFHESETGKIIEDCVKSEESKVTFTKPFSQAGSVRCPGGGCPFSSNSCNKREVRVSYRAPGEYAITDYSSEMGSMNHGNYGDFIPTEKDGHLIGISVHLWCDPPDFPGAPGGWANLTLKGTVRLKDEAGKRRAIADKCRKQSSK